ncbi:MAG: hypothetical protein AAF985_22825, partial [Bacteroidota bacterium]
MKSKIAKWSFAQRAVLGLLFLAVFSLHSCIEKEDGCLDNRATNYDAAAEEACEDCCSFPSLRLEVLHRIQDSLALLNGNRYPYPDGVDSFQVNEIQFYLSELRLETDVLSEGVIDTVVVELQDGSSQTLEDNFSIVSRNNGFNYTLGDYLATGRFDRISFYVGLTEIPNQAVPSSLPDGHPLAVQVDSLHPNDQNGYIFSR